MNVTVAVCTRNRAPLLAGALESLRCMCTPPGLEWEVVVVDNGSVDDTPRTIGLFADRLPLRRIPEPRAGVSHARNRALEEARGAWVLFTDDDARPERDWLTAFAAAAERHPTAAAIGGRIDPFFPDAPDPDLAHAFPMVASGFCGLDHGPDERVLQAPLGLFTANLGLRRQALGDVRFDPRLGPSPRSRRVGEDAALVEALRALGHDVIWCPSMRVRHHVTPSRLRLSAIVRHHVGYSESLVALRGCPRERFLLPRALWNAFLFALNHALGRRRPALARLRAACHWLGTHRGMAGGR